jgi:methyl halide transferase
MLDASYWNSRYLSQTTGWDIGIVSPPLKAYIDQLSDKSKKILIPGCGNSYEAAYLLEKGFKDITIIDIAPALTETLKKKFPAGTYPNFNILTGDFFELGGQYDLILEQTFFCALDPSLREAYVLQMKALLKQGGTLAGVLFNREFEGGPPFGGKISAYQPLFSKYFHVNILAPCYNSIEPRKGSEAFIECINND